MNFPVLILEFLNKHGHVNIPGFGVFYLKDTNASLDNENAHILPPGKEVAFRTETSEKDENLADFIIQKNNLSRIEAEIEIRKLTNFWNSTLEKDGKIAIENIGTFFLDDSKLRFTGERTVNLSPDFYGLEEINLSQIKNAQPTESVDSGAKPYRFSKTIFWLIPVLLGIGVITYLVLSQPEIIFGQKSFRNGFGKPIAKKIVNPSAKTDSAVVKQLATDSLKTDSTATTIAPAKKWSSKKKSTSKWKKSRKPQNH